IDRDLETICLKCLEKEPGRRYSSAEALADDLERWSRGEPISARPVGTVERGWRWCRRNPVVAVLTVAVAMALLAGTIASTFFAMEAGDRARDAEAQAEIANLASADASDKAAQVQHEMDKVRVAKLKAQHTAYVADMNLAMHDWEADNIDRLVDLLEAHRPR